MKRIINIIYLSIFLMSCQKKESTTTGNRLTVQLKMSASQNSTGLANNTFFDELNHYIDMFFFPKALADVPPTLSDAQGNAVILDQGWIVIKEIEFEYSETASSSEVDGDEVELSGPYAVDLFSALPQLLGETQVSLAGIRRIKMQFHNVDTLPVGAPNGLNNNSIYFHGSLNGNDFSFSSQAGGEFEVGGPNLITLRDQTPLLLSIRIVPLIARIDFSLLLSSASPPFNISDSQPYEMGAPICPLIDASATKLYDCFKKGLQQQSELGDDRDEDGEIEEDEAGNK